MFCQKCGAQLSDTTKFCVKCGHKLKVERRMSNKAMLVAAFAAIISAGAALLDFLPKNKPTQAQSEPSSTMVTISPSLRASASPKPAQKPEPTLGPTDLRKHRPTLIYPDDGALFSYIYSSSRIVFRWKPFVGSIADKYKVEVEYGNASHQPPWLLREYETPWNYCTVEFADIQTTEFNGRWRATAVFADGRSGVPTEWRTFRFTK